MHRHQRDGRGVAVVLVLLAHQRHRLEEVGERSLRIAFLELRRDADELTQVLDAALGFHRAVGLELRQVPGHLRGGVDHLRRAGTVVERVGELVHDPDEPGDGSLRPGGEGGDLLGPPACLEERGALVGRERFERGDRRVADPPLRRVDHAPRRDHVLGVHEQPEVAEDVLDLPPLVEADPADHLVGDPRAGAGVLEHP